jgi:D-serine deaminase-like pyridoxal phosphate-dependent protein
MMRVCDARVRCAQVRLHLLPTPVTQPASPLAGLQTPVPVVDLDRLDANLDRVASYAARHGLGLRPHVKTHKSLHVATEQLRRGAIGLTCATPHEAEVMSGVCADLLVAYPPVGHARAERIAALSPEIRVTVALDSAEAVVRIGEAAQRAARQVGVLVELDLGMRRVGVATAEQAVALARLVGDTPGLEYRGIMVYPGHIRGDVALQDAGMQQLRDALHQAVETMHAGGVPPRTISGGSTPTLYRTHELDVLTEFRPGTYVFNDRVTAGIGACSWDDCALTVLATVVSVAVPGQAVIDAGTKALGREPMRGTEDSDGFGALLDRPEVTVRAMSEEHGILDLSRTSWRPAVGDLVRVVPNHVCIVVHLFDEVHGIRAGHPVTRWAVDARGRASA